MPDEIRGTINSLSIKDYSINKKNFKFYFKLVDTQQKKAFGKFRSSIGSGPDGIANFFDFLF